MSQQYFAGRFWEGSQENCHSLHLWATLSYPGQEHHRPWTSPTIPSLTGPSFGEKNTRETREAYWRDIVEQRKAHLPASLNQPDSLNRLVDALARSRPNISDYPASHAYYEKGLMRHSLSTWKKLDQLISTVTGSNDVVSGASIDRGLELPSVDKLWTFFIIGDQGPSPDLQGGSYRPIHYSIPRVMYTRLQYLRVHFLVPEWNFPGYDTHRFFWHGHPQYVGPEPPQEWIDENIRRITNRGASPRPLRNNPVPATQTAVRRASTSARGPPPESSGDAPPLRQPPRQPSPSPYLDHSISMPRSQMFAPTHGYGRYHFPNRAVYNIPGLHQTGGQQHITPDQQIYNPGRMSQFPPRTPLTDPGLPVRNSPTGGSLGGQTLPPPWALTTNPDLLVRIAPTEGSLGGPAVPPTRLTPMDPGFSARNAPTGGFLGDRPHIGSTQQRSNIAPTPQARPDVKPSAHLHVPLLSAAALPQPEGQQPTQLGQQTSNATLTRRAGSPLRGTPDRDILLNADTPSPSEGQQAINTTPPSHNPSGPTGF